MWFYFFPKIKQKYINKNTICCIRIFLRAMFCQDLTPFITCGNVKIAKCKKIGRNKRDMFAVSGWNIVQMYKPVIAYISDNTGQTYV